ncbi:MAG: STAS domain-containing protein [Gammaproteobacteria bacterium]|nr:STAS domain-containing protein [Gammaproteobacteria bacterium]
MNADITTGGFHLPDAITLANIADVRAMGEQHITELAEREDACTFHLAGLEQTNSLAVALLVAWFRYAHVHEKSIVYVDAPRDLRNIIDVYGLTEVLPIS